MWQLSGTAPNMTLTIGNSVTSIGGLAFYTNLSSNFAEIISHPTTPPLISSSTFEGVSTSIPVYVPCSSLVTYQSATFWNNFTNIQTVSSIPSQPEIILGATTVCAGGSAQTYSISPVSGATSYTWNLPTGWSGSSTSTSISATPSASAQSGNITVKANNDCGSSTESTFSVTVNTPPTAPTNIIGITTITLGETTTLTAAGGNAGSGCTYQWGTGTCGSNIISGQSGASITVNPTLNTNYWVRRVGNLPCDTTTTTCASVSVSVLIPVTNITGVPTTATSGTPLTLTGKVVPNSATNQTITWSVKNAGSTGASISGGNILNTTGAGTAVISATIANGVAVGTPFTKDFSINVTTVGIAEQDLSNIRIYPNPTTGQLIIDNGQLTIKSVSIFDIYGKKLYGDNNSYDLTVFPAGIYFLQIHTEQGTVNKKVVKQ